MTAHRLGTTTGLLEGDAGASLVRPPVYLHQAPGFTSAMPGTPLPGDYAVVAYHSPGIVAKGIGLATHSRWTHAFTYLGGDLIGEAAPGGYRIRHLSGYLDRAELSWSHYPLTDTHRGHIVDSAHLLADLHIGYGWADIAAIAAASAGVRSDPIARRLHRPDRMICSAAIAWQYRHADYPITTGPDEDDYVTPSDLAALNGDH